MSVEQVVRPPWIRVAAGTPVRSQEPAVQPRRVFIQVIAGALVVLAAVALVGVAASQRLAEAQSVNDAAKTANLFADALVQPAVRETLLTGDPSAVAIMDQVVRDHVLDRSIVRVKIWDPSGRILYSDEPALIGQTFPLGVEEKDVLTHPQTRADVSDLTASGKPTRTGQRQAAAGLPTDLDPVGQTHAVRNVLAVRRGHGAHRAAVEGLCRSDPDEPAAAGGVAVADPVEAP